MNDNPLWPPLIYKEFSASSGTATLLKDVIEVIDTGGVKKDVVEVIDSGGVKNSSLLSVPLATLDLGSI